MAKRIAEILRDERYLRFQEKYYDNLVDYVVDHSRHTPTWQQMQLYEAATVPGCRVAVSSGHGTGKSAALAWVLDWHLRVFHFSNALLTATNIEQARSVVWKYLDEVIEDMEKIYPWQRGYFVKETRRYYAALHKDSWYVLPRTASKAKPENLAGQHNINYLVVVDEASGVDDVIHDVLRGALTHERNRYVMTSQPTRANGHFAEAMTKLAKKEGQQYENSGDVRGIYDAITMNSELSPLVSMTFIRDKLIEYGGHHSPEYQIRVLGNLPDNLSGYLIPRSWCVQCTTARITHEEAFGYALLCDVAEGVHRDSSVMTLCKISGYGTARKVEVISCDEFLDLDEKVFARRIAAKYREYPAVTIGVDADGAGRTVILELEEMGIAVERVRWGLPCHTKAAQERYLNLRAYAHCQLRDAIFDRRFKGPDLKKFVEQASRLPYKIDERGRYQMLPKDQMKAKGIKSPDISDTCCFAFLVGYVAAEDTDMVNEEDRQMMAWAKEMAQMVHGEEKRHASRNGE